MFTPQDRNIDSPHTVIIHSSTLDSVGPLELVGLGDVWRIQYLTSNNNRATGQELPGSDHVLALVALVVLDSIMSSVTRYLGCKEDTHWSVKSLKMKMVCWWGLELSTTMGVAQLSIRHG